MVSERGIATRLAKVAALQGWTRPTIFLGITGYYRRLFKDFATLAKPLNQFMSKGEEFARGEVQESIFLTLQTMMVLVQYCRIVRKGRSE